MAQELNDVTREKVIRFYAEYDWRKKKREGELPSLLSGLDTWPWNDPDCLDQKLAANGLKPGALVAYHSWELRTISLSDLLECAIVNHIFPHGPQALCQLVLLGNLAEWVPPGNPEWWRLLGNGLELDVKSALILRPSQRSEAPAKWYIEDGSGRALALLQRALRYGETRRTAWAYRGLEPDESSAFIMDHLDLRR